MTLSAARAQHKAEKLASPPPKPVIDAEVRALVLSHFAGKGLERATVAIDGVIASLAEGQWIEGVSRPARAALSKPFAARTRFQKLCKKEWGEQKRPLDRGGAGELSWAMDYGFKYVANARKVTKGPTWLVEMAAAYLKAFAPVSDAFDWLDSMRKLPTFTYLRASPLVTSTLEGMDAVRAFVCPLRYERVPVYNEKTQRTEWEVVCFLEWPENTKHHTAKWSMYNHQCECCGHGIKDRRNWMPMVVQGKDGTHRSLWTGRDCAETLLGVKFTDKLTINDMPAQAPKTK